VTILHDGELLQHVIHVFDCCQPIFSHGLWSWSGTRPSTWLPFWGLHLRLKVHLLDSGQLFCQWGYEVHFSYSYSCDYLSLWSH